ncbi:restriction endonuclease subunit S [Photobacterium phosphoreum]|uniref:restriction endonuclease subunit S n=1 Tax=Photobacterium phosphoreum TaxID=659 RepID=UPI000D18525A|nr:restriction endonuclease subunit S [Photobacterium phosphoreum]PSU39832.1 restriction endonuclease subunit S [Photobacterium phosphoreum]
MSNIVPSGWKTYDLGELALKIEGGGTPSRIEPAFWKGDLPWATVKDLKKVRLTSTLEFISVLGLEQSASKLIPANTMILASRMAVGKAVIFDCDVTINQDLKAFYPKKNLETEFLLQWYLSKSELIESLGTGSTVKGIKLDDIKTLPITLPPYPEQQKIAAILTSVDDGIEKTQAQINKLKDLKTGMMQELLTRGVGVDGKPHTEFKDSPVGRIPKGWDVKSLGDLSSFITSGSRGWAQYYSESGAIFIRIGNLTREHINFRFKDIIRVSPPESAEGKRTLVQAGDVLISITADLGVIAVVNESLEKAYVNQHVALVRLKDIAISRWVGHYLAFEQTQKQFSANNDSGAKAGLNLTAIRNTVVTLPSESEILSIVKSLDSIDDLIFKKRNKLVTLNSTKKALMQDLLTGKVRVNVD